MTFEHRRLADDQAEPGVDQPQPVHEYAATAVTSASGA